jgi:hypothetical protein
MFCTGAKFSDMKYFSLDFGGLEPKDEVSVAEWKTASSGHPTALLLELECQTSHWTS